MSTYVLELGKHNHTHMLNGTLGSLMNYRITGKETLRVDTASKLVEVVVSESETIMMDLDAQTARMITGYVKLASWVNRALVSRSPEFREYFILKYALAVGENEMWLAEKVTADFIDAQAPHAPFRAFKEERIARSIENGVSYSTDVVITQEIHLNDSHKQVLPIVYPVVILGQCIAFNQSFPTPHMVVSYSVDDVDDGPRVAGKVFIESTGEMELQPIADVYNEYHGKYHGEDFHVSIIGSVKQ